MADRRVDWRRVFRVLSRGLGILFILFLCAYFTVLFLAQKKEKEANAVWAKAGLPLEGFLASYPERGETPQEMAIDRTARKLGISLAKIDEGSPSPEALEWKAISPAVGDYGKAELEKATSLAGAPPAEVAAYLSQKAEALQELRNQLKVTTPSWRMEYSKGAAAPIPNLLGNIELTRLLVASSLTAHAAGNESLALADLDAAWRLTEGLEKRPDLICQLVTLAMRKMAIATLRKLDGADPVWDSRLSGWDAYKGLATSYQFEAACFPVFLVNWKISGAGEWDSWLGQLPGKPYLRLCGADSQLVLLKMLETLRASNPCADDTVTQKATGFKESDVPWWNIIGRIALPNLTNSWQRVKYYDIQAELTRKVLAIKRARGADGKWPAEVQGLLESKCPEQKWTYSISPEGEMSLIYSAPLPSQEVVKGSYLHEYRQK